MCCAASCFEYFWTLLSGVAQVVNMCSHTILIETDHGFWLWLCMVHDQCSRKGQVSHAIFTCLQLPTITKQLEQLPTITKQLEQNCAIML